MTNQVLEAFAEKTLNSVIQGINEATAKKQQEVNYWKNQTHLTNEQLLVLLGKRLATGEIKRELTSFGHYLMVETKQGLLKVDLKTGQIKPTQEAKC